MKLVLSLFAVLALCTLASANGPVRQVVQSCHQNYAAPAYVAPAYVAPAVAAYVAPVYVTPLYSHGYGPTSEELEKKLDRLEFELAKQKFAAEKIEFQRQVEKLQAVPIPQQAPQTQLPQKQSSILPNGKEHVAIAIMRNRCANCHETNVAKAKGGNFLMFSGDALSQLSPVDIGIIINEAHTGSMPRNGKKLTDEEYAELVDWQGQVMRQIRQQSVKK